MDDDRDVLRALLTRGEVTWKRDADWEAEYDPLGLTSDLIPDLIAMATDQALHGSTEPAEYWAPVHAWRALGVLRAEPAIGPLLELLSHRDEVEIDDALHSDLPDIFARIGPAALIPTLAYLGREAEPMYARALMVDVLRDLARDFPEHRAEIIAALAATLDGLEADDDEADHEDSDEVLAGFLISTLLDMKAVEAAPSPRNASTSPSSASGSMPGSYWAWRATRLRGAIRDTAESSKDGIHRQRPSQNRPSSWLPAGNRRSEHPRNARLEIRHAPGKRSRPRSRSKVSSGAERPSRESI